MPYADDYTNDNAPDVEHLFTNRNGDTVSESAIEEMEALIEATLIAANTMLTAAWYLIDTHQLDSARDILSGPSDQVSEWVYCATGRNYEDLEQDFGIDVYTMELQQPSIFRTREYFRVN